MLPLRSRSTAPAAERPVVAPTWMIVALAALVGGALWLLYPRQDLEQRLIDSGETELSNSYLNNLLRSDPGNPALRLLLARRQIARGDTVDARITLQPALDSADPALHKRALWTQGELLYQEYEHVQSAQGPVDQAEALKDALERQVRSLASDSWSPDQDLILAAMADRLGISGLGLELRRRAVPKDPAQAEAFYAQEAKAAQGQGDYEGSAQLYLLARKSTSDAAAAKRYYFAAIAALRAGNKPKAALDLAQRELGPLAHDKQALYLLVELARAVGRPDVADHYVRQLLHMDLAKRANPAVRLAQTAVPVKAAWHGVRERLDDRAEFDDGAGLLRHPASGFMRRVADDTAGAAPDAAPSSPLPFDDKTYTLAYQVFLENDKPEDAWAIADTAVRQLPDDMGWHERLAQVSEWTQRPAVALRNWLVVARKTNDEVAWEHVLRLAPDQFNDSDSSQALDDVLRGDVSINPWLSLLLAQRQIAQGEAAKARATLQPVLDSAEPEVRKQALWTQAELAQYQYRHAPKGNSNQRATLRKALQQQVRELAQQPWSAERKTQLAAMANQAGDSDLAMQLYGQSAPTDDPTKLAAFYEREAQMALAQGDYQGSAQLDLLARKNTSDPAEAKRYYFAAVAALRSGNEPKAALELAERELGPLANDRQALYLLTELARAAGRPDVAAKYVRRLLKVGLEQHLETERLAQRQAVIMPAVWRVETSQPELSDDGEFDDGASLLVRPGQGNLRYVVDQAPALNTAKLPFDDKTYTLAYQVFLESKQLEDAWAIADAAVRQRPGDLAWRKRLAQVSEWTNRPVMALDNWLKLAQTTNQEEAWQNVLRIAPGQFDDKATLLALRHELAKRPDDPTLIREFVAAQERVGQPQPAIDYLRQKARSPESLQMLAELAERAGQGKLALDTWRKLFSDPAQITPDRAMRAALLAISQGQSELGLKWLVAAQDTASSSSSATGTVPKSKNQAAKRGGDGSLAAQNKQRETPAVATELARLTGQVAKNRGDNRLAIAAYRKLAASKTAKVDDYDALFQLLKQEHPLEAAHVALLSWQRYGEPRNYFDALTLLSEHRDWTEFGPALTLLDNATGAARKSVPQIRKSAQFLRLMGAYQYQTGRLKQARAYYERAYAADPQSDDTRQELLWLLIDSGDTDALRKILAVHESQWRKNSGLHDALAGAYLALSQPGVALNRYLTPHLAAHRNDFLWMMNYADALEQNDEVGRAWALRRELLVQQYRQMRKGERGKSLTAAQARQWLGGKDMEAARRIARARLLISQRPGDPATDVLRELLRLDRNADGQYSNAAAEVAISWLQEAGQYNAERGFLWQQYARSRAQSAKRPLWAEISVAQGLGDQAATGQLLERQGQSLSAADRASAATAVGDTRLAQSAAFDGLASQPNDDGMQQQLTDSLLDFSRNVSLNAVHRDLGGVSENQTGVGLHLPWNPRWSLDLGLDRINRNVTAHDLYLSAPAESIASATLNWRHVNGETKLKISNRRGYTTTTPVLLQHEQRLSGPFTVRGEVGWHLPVDDTLPLRLGGMKTRLAGSLAYQFTRRDQFMVTQAGERYQLQTGVEVGNASHTTLEYTHAFRTDAPTWQVGAFWSTHHYHSRDPSSFGAQGARFQQTFVPPGQALDAGYLLPTTFQFYGITLSTNTVYQQDYTRAIRPFASMSLTRHSQLGAGYDLTLGVAGSVLGGDHLSLGWEISKSGVQSLGFTRSLQLSYQLNF